MDVEQKGEDTQPRGTEPGAEAAAAKIWAIYIGEAEKYDKGLVESWRSDMDGMLIFAGLFSASLTAFLIESYKTLNSDSGDATVQLLAQISQQLAASANGSAFVVTPSPKFTPSGSALVCNGLWFISLGLSLSCALIATLLEQWARDFIHRSEIRSAPLIRARIFSFLYYGMKRFNMHAVVEIIPLLLHTALIFFLAGLVAFLIPVNTVMAVVAAVMLAILTAIYSSLTVLPLCYLDSPYRTPLSGIFWRAVQSSRVAWQRRQTSARGKPGVHSPKEDQTILEAVFHRAIEDCDERKARDGQALVWTVKSLSDELELEPFIQAIPSILWGPTINKQRFSYADHFRQLVFHPDVALYDRLEGLLDSCDTGIGVLSTEAAKRREILCYKALWAITSLFISPSAATPPIPESLLVDYRRRHDHPYAPTAKDQNEVYNSFASAYALIQWINFHTVKPRLEEFLRHFKMNLTDDAVTLNYLTTVIEFLTDVDRQWLHDDIELSNLLLVQRHTGLDLDPSLASVSIPSLVGNLQRILDSRQYAIRHDYLHRASVSHSLPYSFGDTMRIIQPPSDMCLPREDYEVLLDFAVSRQLKEFNSPETEWMDTVVKQILSDCSAQVAPGSIAALSGVIKYLNGRQSDEAVRETITYADDRGWLWESFAQSLRDGPEHWSRYRYRYPPTLPDLLMALWRYTILGFPERYPSATSFHGVLNELTRFGSPTFIPSVLMSLKFRYLAIGNLPGSETRAERADEIHPTESAVLEKYADYDYFLPSLEHAWRAEATIPHLAQFLESCAGPEPFPYKALETLQHLELLHIPGPVHKNHQIRLADAIRGLFANPRCADLRTVFVNTNIFDLYAGGPYDPQTTWLDHNVARETIKHAFNTYAEELSTSTESSADLERVRTILREFDRLHPDVASHDLDR
ncbi:hypothetical protein C8R47DRAFT_1321532 [Mycena vitilis]|nr:hypothetical protein C8R47DRAFT_1321532 [Mycena vitilis]